MSFTRVFFKPSFFGERGFQILSDDEFSAKAFRYESGVEGLEIVNSCSTMVVLPYMGMQVWFVNFNGELVSQKSMFDMPLNNTLFGDNYGGFLYHCGLNNINAPDLNDVQYPIHDVLPFARFEKTYTGIGEDTKGRFLAVGGTYTFRNSQELYWTYTPELRLYEGKTVVEMSATIENYRMRPFNYFWMCHMNWLGVDGSKFIYSCPKDSKHIYLDEVEEDATDPRSFALHEYSQKLKRNPLLADILDSKCQVYDPELCFNYRYEADQEGWAHSLMVRPNGSSYYVSWEIEKAPYAIRWLCRTGNEDGVGIALPSTGTNRGTSYQRDKGHYNTLEPNSSDTIKWKFGLLQQAETKQMTTYIKQILESEPAGDV